MEPYLGPEYFDYGSSIQVWCVIETEGLIVDECGVAWKPRWSKRKKPEHDGKYRLRATVYARDIEGKAIVGDDMSFDKPLAIKDGTLTVGVIRLNNYEHPSPDRTLHATRWQCTWQAMAKATGAFPETCTDDDENED
jgi:hypothetical protein